MNENHSFNSKAHKNKDTGVLMHSFACKYYFLIAILKGETRRFEPQAPSEGKQANLVESFSFIICSLSCHPQWCSGYSTDNLRRKPKFKSLGCHKVIFHLLRLLNYLYL